MKKISNEQWQFPQNDPRVAIGAKVAELSRGKVQAIGVISKLTQTQLQAEGLYPQVASSDNCRYYRANGRIVGSNDWQSNYIVLATEAHVAQFEQYKAEHERRRAELAERKAIAARSAEANLRRYVALIRAAGSDEAAMEHLSCFANNADVYGLGAEWPESESSNGA